MGKRDKADSKQLKVLRSAYGLTAPYSVLCDGSFVNNAFEAKAAGSTCASILAPVLHCPAADVKCIVTPCIIHEIDALFGRGSPLSKHVADTALFSKFECGHAARSTSACDCIRQLVALGPKFLVATQDPALRNVLRPVPHVATAYRQYSVALLDRTDRADELPAGPASLATFSDDGPQRPKKAHRVAKGPNPLSHQRKHKKGAVGVRQATREAPRRRRKATAVPQPEA
jgi:rRNA-processing protein FCF1